MRVLITGGTGFIGARLALKTIERGYAARVLGQTNTEAERANAQLLSQHGVELMLGSVQEPDRINAAAENCDLVFHLAAAQHEANVPDRHFWNVNVEGTRNVLQASLAAGVKRFVHGSTIGVYGAALDGEIDEESPLRPDNIYGVTKKEAEQLVLSFGDRLPVSIIRISETYGPGDRRLLKLFKAIKKNAFFVIGDGRNKHQLVYVDDLIDGMYRAAFSDQAVGEIFVLAGREVLTTREMVDTIARSMGTKVPRLHAPMWPFLGAAVMMEVILRPLGVQPPLHRRRMDFFRKSFFFSQKKPAKLLGYNATTGFADGVAKTLQWYEAERAI